jgi:sulfite reductase (NADPH) flavoprotein alpha-component
VLALGDTSYPLFCKAGEDVDAQLQKIGGERLVPVQKCDTDYAADADAWLQAVMQSLGGQQNALVTAVATKKETGKKIYTGTVLTNINLNDRGSNKQTHHIEIAAEGVTYNPGDALGLIPRNATATVDAIVELLGMQKGKEVFYKGEPYTLFDLLQQKLNIAALPERVVKQYAALVQQDIPVTKISLLDLLKIYPLKETSQVDELISILEPIAPRLYSISSSPEAHADEVHITVARDMFRINEDVKYGLCSDYLCGFELDKTFDFYIHKNGQFTLPAEDKDIIMIGPGTGVAPFRSFLAHRAATGATGRNWLFFGDQHFVTDFLYQTELQDWVQTSVLTKLDVAFSRDGKDKVYVQHKMKKQQAELYNWLQNGAYLYVCGSKEPMSMDVENTLINIIQEVGNKTIEEAEAFVAQLKEEGRYLKDVY